MWKRNSGSQGIEDLRAVIRDEFTPIKEAIERETKDTRQFKDDVARGFDGLKQSFEGVKQYVEREISNTDKKYDALREDFRDVSRSIGVFAEEVNKVKIDNSAIKSTAKTIFVL